MFTRELVTGDESIRLIQPDIERDASLGVQWLANEAGRTTLHAMGVADQDNQPSDIDSERERVKQFLDNPDQMNWMIEAGGRVVGAVWVDLVSTDHVQAPAVHIMIGDPDVRGRGVGGQVFQSVIDFLERDRHEQVIHTRHLAENSVAARLAENVGFRDDGLPYQDTGGLVWQNMKREDGVV